MGGRSLWRRLRGPVLLLLLTAAGCSQQDADRLVCVGHKGVQRLRELTGEARDTFADELHSLGSDPLQASVAARVATRLRLERALSGSGIEVRASGADVELHGEVQGEPRRRRAVDLAETTVGVERVVDRLRVRE
jgi:hypothetical protein